MADPLKGGAHEGELLQGTTIRLEDGQVIQLIDRGEGVPLVFIHGLPGQASDFSACIAALSSDYRCIAYDRPGYAASMPLAAGRGAGIAHNVKDLLDLLDRLSVERAVLIGWSYGGHIAVQTAVEHPERVSGLIMLGAAGPSFQWPINGLDWLLFRTPVGQYLMRLVRAFGVRALKPSMDDAYGGPTPASLVNSFLTSIRNNDAIAHWLKEGNIWDPSTSPVSQVTQPCLVMHGDADTRIPFAVAEDVHCQIPQSQLEKLPGVGHWPFASHPQEVVAKCREFLAANLSG